MTAERSRQTAAWFAAHPTPFTCGEIPPPNLLMWKTISIPVFDP